MSTERACPPSHLVFRRGHLFFPQVVKDGRVLLNQPRIIPQTALDNEILIQSGIPDPNQVSPSRRRVEEHHTSINVTSPAAPAMIHPL